MNAPVPLGILASSLTVGGAEQLLLEFLRRLDRSRFAPTLYLLREPGLVGAEVQKLGVPCRSNILAGGKGPIVPVRLASLFTLDKIEVLLLINHRNALFYGVPGAKLAGVKAVVNWENETFKRYRFHELFMAVRRGLMWGVDAAVGVARGHSNYVVEHEKVPARKVVTIVNAVDPEKFASDLSKEAAKAALGIDPKRKVAGILAVLRPDKAHEMFLTAAKMALESVDAHFLVVGDGPRRAELQAMAESMGLSGRVSFLGFKRDGLPGVLAAIDVICLSSKPLQETLSVAALEAMSTGLPMICTKVGFMDEIVIPGVTGELVEVGDAPGMARAMTAILGDDAKRREMGENAARLVREKYTLGDMTLAFENLFAELLRPRPDLARIQGVAGTRLCLLVSWPEKGQWRLLRGLRKVLLKVDVMAPGETVLARSGRASRFKRRFRLAFMALAALKGAWRYHVLASWSTTQGVWLGAFLRLMPRRLRPTHVCRDFHLNLSRTDLYYRMRTWILRRALPGIDLLLCTSREEAGVYATMFGLEPSRLAFYPDDPPGELLERPLTEPGSYVFAYGNSDRDFEVLLRAAPRVAAEIVILTQIYTLPGPLPDNVRVMGERVSGEELIGLVEGAAVVVAPTAKREVAAGQNVMLEAMCLGRAVVATANVALVEYSAEGEAAVFFPPGDEAVLADKLNGLLGDRQRLREMGRRGRARAMTMAATETELFLGLLAPWRGGAGKGLGQNRTVAI